MQRFLIFSIHILTASGAALALLALMAAAQDDWRGMFVWLAIALLVDAVDGPLARACNVKKIWPSWSGETLDLVVDFLTYVMVPAYALAMGGVLPASWATPLAMAVVISGALYFADQRMKLADHCFRGFPALWNGVAFYIFALKPEPLLSGLVIIALVVMTFVPVPFLHPIRVQRWRPLTIGLSALGLLLAGATLYNDFSIALWMKALLLCVGLYMLFAGAAMRILPWGNK